jgi:ABC-type transport system involved in multi-copper enzyme maturation permease subunit
MHFAGVVPFGPFLSAIMGSKTGPIGFQLFILARLVLYFGSWVAVLTGVVITSFFIPNMLHKGTVDLLLSKPLQRWLLLLYKYVGGLTFIFLNAAYAIGGIWLVIGIRTGVWANGSLLLILTITFFFAILYAISTFIAVLTRSTVTAILGTIIAWASFWGIGLAHGIFHDQYLIEKEAETRGQPIPEDARWGDNRAANAIYFVHRIMPRTKDLDQLNEMIVFTDFMTGQLSDLQKFNTSQRDWWESMIVSSGWIAIFLGFACVRFTLKDY